MAAILVDINNVTTTGHGPTSVTAQNGIETWGASGTIENCTISQIAYTGGTWSASGLLVTGLALSLQIMLILTIARPAFTGSMLTELIKTPPSPILWVMVYMVIAMQGHLISQ